MLPSLSRNVAASVVNAGAAIGSSLVAVPLILGAVGTAGYGVWSLGLALVLYVSILETGLGPAVQRYVAVASGAGDRLQVSRLLWSTLLAYAALGAAGLGLLQLTAPALAGLFDLPAGLRPDAEAMFGDLGFALALALLAAGAGNVLQGLERFKMLAATSAVGAVAFLGAVAALAESDGLPGLAAALAVQNGVVLLGRLIAVRDVSGAPGAVSRATARGVLGFSARLQVTALSELVNWQSDKVVVGLVAPAATVGQLSIGGQFADGGRALAGAALAPVQSAFAVAAGARDEAGLRRSFAQLHRLWLLGVLGAAVVGAASLHPLIEAWLGDGYGTAAVLGAFLVLGSAAGLSTGTGVAYLRAVGRPGLEARYGLVVVGANLLLTIPLAITVGAIGVVIGTLGAYLAGMSWFFAGLRAHVPISPFRTPSEGLRALGAALIAGAASLALGTGLNAALPRGVALPFVAAGTLGALALYVGAVLGLRTPAELRRLLGQASGTHVPSGRAAERHTRPS
jgi:O-antigen/teichoic acid export membrane protein